MQALGVVREHSIREDIGRQQAADDLGLRGEVARAWRVAPQRRQPAVQPMCAGTAEVAGHQIQQRKRRRKAVLTGSEFVPEI